MTPTLHIHAVHVPAPFQAVRLACGKHPFDNTAPAAQFALRLCQEMTKGSLLAVFLQDEYLKHRKQVFLDHVPRWSPAAGLGVWPDRPAPELWKTADLFRMAAGEKVPLMYSVSHVRAESESMNALQTMLGSGMVVALVHRAPVATLMAQFKSTFLPDIQAPNLRIMRFYMPLLDMKSLTGRTESELRKWLGDTRFYLRESPDDGAILAVSADPLEEALVRCGARRASPGHWIVG